MPAQFELFIFDRNDMSGYPPENGVAENRQRPLLDQSATFNTFDISGGYDAIRINSPQFIRNRVHELI